MIAKGIAANYFHHINFVYEKDNSFCDEYYACYIRFCPKAGF